MGVINSNLIVVNRWKIYKVIIIHFIMNNKVKQMGKYVGTAAVVVALTVGAIRGPFSKLESSIDKFDATGDGIQDVVLFDAENRDYFAFIGQKDGTFEKAKVIMQDGIPFYQTENGHYDSCGNYFSKQE